MKITKSYLKQIIQEELSSIEELIQPGSAAEKQLADDQKEKYELTSDADAKAAIGVDNTLSQAALNPNLSDKDITDIAASKGLNKNNPVLQRMAKSKYVSTTTANPSNPSSRIALAIKKIASGAK